MFGRFSSLVFLVLFARTNSDLSQEYQNSTFLDKKNVLKLYWSHNRTSDVLKFAVHAQITGWVGVGFAKCIHKMKDYDVVVGKVQNGVGVLTDRFTQGFREPPADRQQDYTLTDFAESDGRTILKFHRKRDTKDDRDIEIKTGPMLLVYAYHSLDYPSPYKTLHEKQGWKTVTLLHEDSGTTTTSTATLKPTSLPTHVATKTVQTRNTTLRVEPGPDVEVSASSQATSPSFVIVINGTTIDLKNPVNSGTISDSSLWMFLYPLFFMAFSF